jgi:hypothetical protein
MMPTAIRDRGRTIEIKMTVPMAVDEVISNEGKVSAKLESERVTIR